jgi:hypothetical protein
MDNDGKNANCNFLLGVPSMSIWGSIYRVGKGCHHNVGYAPVQPLPPKIRRSWGHYGLLIFTVFSVLGQQQLDTCPLAGWPHLGGAPASCNLRSDLANPQSDEGFTVERGCSFLQNRQGCEQLCYWRRSST